MNETAKDAAGLAYCRELGVPYPSISMDLPEVSSCSLLTASILAGLPASAVARNVQWYGSCTVRRSVGSIPPSRASLIVVTRPAYNGR